MSNWYLLYAKAGMEMQVAEDIEALGRDVICPARGEFKRKGKQRRAELCVGPYLPNYLFAEIPDECFLEVMQIKGLAITAKPVSGADMARVRQFRDAARAEYAEAVRISQNQQARAEFKRGDAVRFLDGRFGDQILQFRSIVERAHDLYPKLLIEGEMMGQVVKIEADPLDVKAAE